MFENRSSVQISIVGEFIESNCMRMFPLPSCRVSASRVEQLPSAKRLAHRIRSHEWGQPWRFAAWHNLCHTFWALVNLDVFDSCFSLPSILATFQGPRRQVLQAGGGSLVSIIWSYWSEYGCKKNKQTNCVLIWKPQNNMKWKMFCWIPHGPSTKLRAPVRCVVHPFYHSMDFLWHCVQLYRHCHCGSNSCPVVQYLSVLAGFASLDPKPSWGL